MNITIINETRYKTDEYRSPIANTFNGNGMLENYIIAKLTNRNTIRLILDQNMLKEE